MMNMTELRISIRKAAKRQQKDGVLRTICPEFGECNFMTPEKFSGVTEEMLLKAEAKGLLARKSRCEWEVPGLQFDHVISDQWGYWSVVRGRDWQDAVRAASNLSETASLEHASASYLGPFGVVTQRDIDIHNCRHAQWIAGPRACQCGYCNE